MAKRNVEILKGSWLDMKGQRWMKVAIDVMIGVINSSVKSR